MKIAPSLVYLRLARGSLEGAGPFCRESEGVPQNKPFNTFLGGRVGTTNLLFVALCSCDTNHQT